MDQKITLGGKEFIVPEMPIGRRKFLVPAIRKLYEDFLLKPEEERFLFQEFEYDQMIEIISRAVFPQIKREDILMIALEDVDLLSAIRVILTQCGMRIVEKTASGEAQGEKQSSPTTTV